MLLLTSASSSELHQPPSLYAIHSPSRSPEALQPSRRPSSLSSLSALSYLPPSWSMPALQPGLRLSHSPLCWPALAFHLECRISHSLAYHGNTKTLDATEKPIKPSCREIFQVTLFLRIDWSVGGDFMPSLLIWVYTEVTGISQNPGLWSHMLGWMNPDKRKRSTCSSN